GEEWKTQYDPNSFLYISRAMDMFDLSQWPDFAASITSGTTTTHQTSQTDRKSNQHNYNYKKDLSAAIASIKCPALVIGAKSDFSIPVWQQHEIATLLKEAGNTRISYFEVDGAFGHDTFLHDVTNIGYAVKGYLENEIVLGHAAAS
ncbi:hypothetical protein HK100_010443, partial [Physocladia obscura]